MATGKSEEPTTPRRRLGLAAAAGALADWEDLEAVVQEIYANRRRSRDRPGPEL